MNLGTQYYRAPFPESKYWDDDFARIADSGLNTVQLWVIWGWVEAKPGVYQFGDYDQLVNLADKHGLGVILSTIAEIHPYWIHREVPGSEMIDHRGCRVVSSNRIECHYGITPGGCFDHPGVWDRMAAFLHETARQYAPAPNLRGWDCWNEKRWSIQSDGLVCFCDHTLAAFRQWLDAQYGGLDGLNKAWHRRYEQWDEVWPGKVPGRPYTEMMAFEHFITHRADLHAKARYDIIKAADPARPVTVHGCTPSALFPGHPEEYAIGRGNDWNLADGLDGVGCSSFPKWQGLDDADFGLRVEFVKSAAGEKRVWLSEVQGGRAATGFDVHEPVDPASQQRWIWNGLACGADTILFWCWRDEVFGHESGGFGIAGADGLADARIEALRRTGAILREHSDLFAAYRPARPQIGLWHSPQTYYLGWAQEWSAGRAVEGVAGYARGLVRASVPYLVVEEEHRDALDGLKVLFLPRTLVTTPDIEERFARFVHDGGTLVVESECGAFGPDGLYRYPEDRFLNRLCGVREIGRRRLTEDTIEVSLDGMSHTTAVAQWTTPYALADGTILAAHPDGPLIAQIPCGKGRVIACGTYLGDAYRRQFTPGFERFIEWIARSAGWTPEVTVVTPERTREAFVYVKQGEAHGRKVLFVFLPDGHAEARLRLAPGFLNTGTLRDLITGESVALEKDNDGTTCMVRPCAWRVAILAQE